MLRTCCAGVCAPRARCEALLLLGLPRLRLLLLLLVRLLFAGGRGCPGRVRDIGGAQFVALPAIHAGGQRRTARAQVAAGLTGPVRSTIKGFARADESTDIGVTV